MQLGITKEDFDEAFLNLKVDRLLQNYQDTLQKPGFYGAQSVSQLENGNPNTTLIAAAPNKKSVRHCPPQAHNRLGQHLNSF